MHFPSDIKLFLIKVILFQGRVSPVTLMFLLLIYFIF